MYLALLPLYFPWQLGEEIVSGDKKAVQMGGRNFADLFFFHLSGKKLTFRVKLNGIRIPAS